MQTDSYIVNSPPAPKGKRQTRSSSPVTRQASAKTSSDGCPAPIFYRFGQLLLLLLDLDEGVGAHTGVIETSESSQTCLSTLT